MTRCQTTLRLCAGNGTEEQLPLHVAVSPGRLLVSDTRTWPLGTGPAWPRLGWPCIWRTVGAKPARPPARRFRDAGASGTQVRGVDDLEVGAGDLAKRV